LDGILVILNRTPVDEFEPETFAPIKQRWRIHEVN